MKITCRYKLNEDWFIEPNFTKKKFNKLAPTGYRVKKVYTDGEGTYDIIFQKKKKKYTRKQLIDFANSILIFNRIDFEVNKNFDIEEWINYKENYRK